ncbi:MAG: PrgI family protein, partial [Acidimicrobiales bacterium]
MSEPAGPRVRIPADVEREDRLLAGLSARQLAILAVAAVLLWVGYQASRAVLPLPVFAGLAAPVAGVAVVLALGRRHGLPADRLLLAALAQARA